MCAPRNIPLRSHAVDLDTTFVETLPSDAPLHPTTYEIIKQLPPFSRMCTPEDITSIHRQAVSRRWSRLGPRNDPHVSDMHREAAVAKGANRHRTTALSQQQQLLGIE